MPVTLRRFLTQDRGFDHDHPQFRIVFEQPAQGARDATAIAAVVVKELDQGDLAFGIAQNRRVRILQHRGQSSV